MKKSLLLVILGLASCLMAVGANNTSEVQYAPAQDIKKYGEDSVTCIQNISLYREFYKQWKSSKYKNESVKDAVKPWKWLLKNCPASTENLYVDGPKIMGYLIDNEKDPAVKEKLVDTLMMIYDMRYQYFPSKKGADRKGYVLARKGVDLIQTDPKRYEQAYNILKEAIEIEGPKASGSALVYYMYTTVKMVQNKKLDKSVVVDIYDLTSTYLNDIVNKYQQKGDTKRAASYEKYLNNVEKYFEPYANCDDLVSIYQEKFDANPNDLKLLKRITGILAKKKCDDTPLFFAASENLYKLEPSPEAALNIGIMLVKQKETAKSIDYLKQAESLTKPDDLKKVYILLADAYKTQGSYSAGRDYAYKALKIDPNLGQAYLIIAQMYGASGKLCAKDEIEKSAVYWAAVDQCYKAKQVDPELAPAANKLINSYSKLFPKVDRLFFHNLKEGETYEIGCWMNVSTKVRAGK